MEQFSVINYKLNSQARSFFFFGSILACLVPEVY